ncbi:DUF1800 domain-containing protein [Actinoplanes bogorensis]|uniref:DUF1800 domain-containing protein n=1 Tax=Paractinoplanes bogorensis TaxID=1610840 RepID=A0ABS5YL17_9ACTN|nr:DUF1800 domain-containing protein [Actinoplanes bogorensis]MBU2664167.1 DUF1800 domain-containing protein [Actinoplanes bogorensis]
MTDRTQVAHLLRRLTFGPTAAEVDAAGKAGFDATVERLLKPVAVPSPPDIGDEPAAGETREQRQANRKTQREQVTALGKWWLGRMAAGGAASGEKLTFFWHGHWATSAQKVRSAHLMLAQQQTFRRYGTGDTSPLVRAMLRDPALILWLDGQKNTRKAPNENLAREVMELFTLGVGAYGEADVKAGARVLTGWSIDRAAGTAKLVAKRHDPGQVTLLGQTGVFDLDAYADLLVRHEAHVPFIARRLWARYAGSDLPPPSVAAAGRNTTALLRAVVRAPEFAATNGLLVKQPIEWVMGAVRQLGIPAKGTEGYLKSLGQVPLRPPSVGGWPAGAAWLTTSSTLTRLKAGQKLAAQYQGDALSGADRVEALANLLVVDGWSDRTAAVLKDVKEPRKLLALGLASPEYAVH